MLEATWKDFLFSPTGRFNRARFWGASLLAYGGMILYVVPAIVLSGNGNGDAVPDWVTIIYVLIGIPVFIALILIHIFAVVKRFHDRDKSWPWYFVSFIPYVGGLWILAECGCMPGTSGHNRFGADPLNPTQIADVFDGPPIPGQSPAAPSEPRLPGGFGVTSQDRVG